MNFKKKHLISFLSILFFTIIFVNFVESYTYNDFLELKANTDQCLVNCEATILLKNPTADPITVNTSTLKFWFIHNKTEINWHIEKLNQLNETIPIYETVCNTYNETITNSTINGTFTLNNCTKKILGYNTGISYKFENYNYDEIIQPGENWTIKLVSYKSKTDFVDWKINFNNYEPEWQWWNTNWKYRRAITITNTDISNHYYEFFNIQVDSSGWTNKPYKDSIRIIDSNNNEIPIRVTNTAQNNGIMDSFNIWVMLNNSANTDTNFYMYYNDLSTGSAIYQYYPAYLFEDFNDCSDWDFTLGGQDVVCSDGFIYLTVNMGRRWVYRTLPGFPTQNYELPFTYREGFNHTTNNAPNLLNFFNKKDGGVSFVSDSKYSHPSPSGAFLRLYKLLSDGRTYYLNRKEWYAQQYLAGYLSIWRDENKFWHYKINNDLLDGSLAADVRSSTNINFGYNYFHFQARFAHTMKWDWMEWLTGTVYDISSTYNLGPEETAVVGCDLEVVEIKPVQVVYDVDLVKDKSTAARVKIKNNGPNSCTATAKLTYLEISTTDIVKTLSSGEEQYFDFYFTPPTAAQNIQIKADVISDITDPNPNNNSKTKDVNVKDTEEFHLIYFSIDNCLPPFDCYGPLTEYYGTFEHSNLFIKATFPVAGDEFVSQSGGNYYGDPTKCIGKNCPGISSDLISLAVWGKLTMWSRDRSVGIVPKNYFAYHDLSKYVIGNITGISSKGIHGVISTEGYWTTVAHEIGHTYELPVNLPPSYKEEYESVSPDGRAAEGFWVEGRRPIENSICFMGTSPYHEFGKKLKDYFGRWVDNSDYKHLLKKLKIASEDPEVLLVSGIIFKDGTIQLKDWYKIEEASIDYVIPGNYSIRLLDVDENIISDIKFDAPFEMYVDPIGVIETDITGFAFAIPYPEETATIQITYQEKVLTEVTPTTKLLHDAIDLIPDYGFINNAEQRRKALHNKISAVEKMLKQKNKEGARNKLQYDIKDKLEKWLIVYEKENILQFTKEEIINLIDSLIARLN